MVGADKTIDTNCGCRMTTKRRNLIVIDRGEIFKWGKHFNNNYYFSRVFVHPLYFKKTNKILGNSYMRIECPSLVKFIIQCCDALR